MRASPLMEKTECPHCACQPSALHALARGRARHGEGGRDPPPHPPARPSLERAEAGGDAACRGAACVGESVIPRRPLSILGCVGSGWVFARVPFDGALVVLHLCIGALVICTAYTNVEYCTSCSKCVCRGPCRSSFMHVLHFTHTLVELPYVRSVNCIHVCLERYTDISILISIFI